MENIDKLPKWAQQRIRLLERRVEELKEALAQRNGEAGDGRVILNPFSDDARLTFPTDTTVRFSVSGEKYRGYFEFRHKPKEGTVEVHGSGAMIIKPHVTNVISLCLVD